MRKLKSSDRWAAPMADVIAIVLLGLVVGLLVTTQAAWWFQ